MSRRRRQRQTGKMIGVGLLAVLLLILAGMAYRMLSFGKNGYAQGYGAYETVSSSGAVRSGRTAAAGSGEASASGGNPEISIVLETAGADLKAGQAAEEASPVTEQENRAVLLFAGDVYLSNHVLNAYDKAGGIHGVLDEKIRQEIEAADLFVVNQEFPFTDRGTSAEDKQFTFRIPANRVHVMKEMGIDLVTLANNHILDYGAEGLLDSCEILDEAGIFHVGAGKNLEQAKAPVTADIGGRTIGFLGTSRVYMDGSWAAAANHPGVFSTYDSRQALAEIKAARESCDYLVVYVHWGVEKETVPKEYQRTLGREYMDAGADLVIGSHPHVLQEIEYYNGKPIVYSLGNFVFGSSIPETELLKVVITEDGAELTVLPCVSSGGFTRMK